MQPCDATSVIAAKRPPAVEGAAMSTTKRKRQASEDIESVIRKVARAHEEYFAAWLGSWTPRILEHEIPDSPSAPPKRSRSRKDLSTRSVSHGQEALPLTPSEQAPP